MSQSRASTDAATKNLRFTHKICLIAIGTVCVARSCRALFRLRKPPSLSTSGAGVGLRGSAALDVVAEA